MKALKIEELIEKVRDNNADRIAAAHAEQNDANDEYNLDTAGRSIKSWKAWYMKKNSAKSATIEVRCGSN